jgi:hypothetical protein
VVRSFPTPLLPDVTFPVPAVHHALDSVFQVGDVEVDQQTDVFLTEAQIRKQLGLVDGMDGFDTLDLDYDEVFHE